MGGKKGLNCLCCFRDQDSIDMDENNSNSDVSGKQYQVQAEDQFGQEQQSISTKELHMVKQESGGWHQNLQKNDTKQKEDLETQDDFGNKGNQNFEKKTSLNQNEMPNKQNQNQKYSQGTNFLQNDNSHKSNLSNQPYKIKLGDMQRSFQDKGSDSKQGQENGVSTEDLYKQAQALNALQLQKQDDSGHSDIERIIHSQSSDLSIAQSLDTYLDQENTSKNGFSVSQQYSGANKKNNALHSVEFPKLQDGEKQQKLVEQFPKIRNRHLNQWILKHVQAEDTGLTSEQLKANLQLLQQKNKLQSMEEDNDQDHSLKNQLSAKRGFNSSRTSFSVTSWDSGSLATLNQNYKKNQIQSSKKVVPKLTNSIQLELENDKQVKNENPSDIYSVRSSASEHTSQRKPQTRSKTQSLNYNISRRRRVRRLIDDLQFESSQADNEPNSGNSIHSGQVRLFNSDQLSYNKYSGIDDIQQSRISEGQEYFSGAQPDLVSGYKRSKSRNLNSNNLQDSISFDSQQFNSICFNEDQNQKTQNERLRASSPGISFNKQPLFESQVAV